MEMEVGPVPFEPSTAMTGGRQSQNIDDHERQAKTEQELIAQENQARIRKGMLHSSRLGSFIAGGWPTERETKDDAVCTPHELALAGLEYVAQGSAQCCVCWTVLSNLEPSSDPWECHRTANPDCPLIKLGKPSIPDEYTMQQFFTLVAERQAHYQETLCRTLDEFVETTMEDIVNQEIADFEENCNNWDDSF